VSTWPSTLPLPSPAYGFDIAGRAIYGAGERVHSTSRTRDGEIVFTFDVEWVFTDTEFAAFKTYFQTDLFDGALPFEISLASGDSLGTHTVFFMGGRFSGSSAHGFNHSVVAQLVCHSPPLMAESLLDDLLDLSVEYLDFVDQVGPLNDLVEHYIILFQLGEFTFEQQALDMNELVEFYSPQYL